ncbi:universal stress protein [Rhodovibrio salinarum]|uniref:Universal stress protein n=1 Tax=Rhodovibrio salinarum TaxID=1087 RepID=A0A934QFN0_9PROT|nr:universal stress protein [Rhodovibrio salinarum]MBK1695898.1 universal stress protein [Rhodovibrio salinarum]
MFQNILVPIRPNRPSTWRKALPLAIGEARRHGATLHVVTVTSDVASEDDKKTAHDVARELQDLVDAQVPRDVKVEAEIYRGASVHRNVRKAAEERNCDLIVMNSHRPDLRDYLIGSNASQIVRHATCSVLVVR